MSIHFIGVDAGGTSTRAMLATASGAIIGRGRGPGANSWSSGTAVADVVADVIEQACGSIDKGTVAGGVVAMAGGGSSSFSIRAEIEERWRSLGITGAPSMALDVLAAYAAGTTAREGVVLAAGTGAIAAWVVDGAVDRRAGGHGYLVGDEGSAVWLAVQGVQAALQALDGRAPPSALTGVVLDHFQIEATAEEARAAAIVAATYSRPPAQLGALAPDVIEAAAAGDAIAVGIVNRAVDELEAIAVAAAAGRTPHAVVLAGSLATAAPLIGDPVRTRLSDRWPTIPVVHAASGEAGAVALAIAEYAGEPISDEVLERLRG